MKPSFEQLETKILCSDMEYYITAFPQTGMELGLPRIPIYDPIRPDGSYMPPIGPIPPPSQSAALQYIYSYLGIQAGSTPQPGDGLYYILQGIPQEINPGL